MKRKRNDFAKKKQEEEDLVVLLLLNAMKRKPRTRSYRSFKRKRAYRRRRANQAIEVQDTGGGFIGPELMDEQVESEGAVITQDSQGEKRDLSYDSDEEFEEMPYMKLRAVD